jgi:uncharacterized protein
MLGGKMSKILENRYSEDEIVSYIESVLSKKLKRNKSIKKFTSSPIIVPDRFLAAIKHSENDLLEIENYANTVHEISCANGGSLKFYEDYFQLRLEAHVGRQEVLSSIFRCLIFFLCIIIIFGFFDPNFLKKNLISHLISSAAFAGVLELIYKGFYVEKLFHSTLAYRYCILILKRAQEIKLEKGIAEQSNQKYLGFTDANQKGKITSSLLKKIKENRSEILGVAQHYGASNLRIFGSVSRGEDDHLSDIDLLVDLESGRTLFDLGGLAMDLQEILGCSVDVVTEKGLRKKQRKHILHEAISL